MKLSELIEELQRLAKELGTDPLVEIQGSESIDCSPLDAIAYFTSREKVVLFERGDIGV